MIVEENGVWVWRGLESFFGVKHEEGGRKRPLLKSRASQRQPSRRAWVAFALLRARALPRPAPSPPRARLRGRPGWARRASDFVPVTGPPGPHQARARDCWRGRAGARGTAGARAGPGASMMEERAAAAVAAAASSCRPLGSGAGPGPTGAAPVSAPAPGPGPAAKGGGGGGSPGPTAGPEPLSLPGILHFIQHEWARFEAEKARWEAERAELQVSTAPGPPTPRPARAGPASPAAAAAAILEQWPPGRPGGRVGDRDRPRDGVRGRPRGILRAPGQVEAGGGPRAGRARPRPPREGAQGSRTGCKWEWE